MRKTVRIANLQRIYQGDMSIQLPYVYGALRSHAEQFDDIRAGYDFPAPVVSAHDVAAMLGGPAPDVVGFSVYVWNHEYSHAVARAVREKFPGTLIVFGGPHVPNHPSRWLQEHPWADLCVHGEGESPFTAVLREWLHEAPSWNDIDGLSFLRDGVQHFTQPGKRLATLNLPSPFASGYFDEFLSTCRGRGLNVRACLETNRGCPYSCAFCDWGMAISTKLRQYPMERVLAEFDWISQQGIELVFLNDANFGLLPRDIDIMRHVVELKRRTGYPRELIVLGFAKNNKDRAFEINRLIRDNELESRGNVNFSLQATNQTTLDAIARQNIPLDNYRELADRYAEVNYELVPDLIFPLPGETLESFKAGYADLASWPHVKFIRVYPCAVLPNAPMAQAEYRQKWGLQTCMTPLVVPGLPLFEAGETEWIEVVTATSLIDAPAAAEARLFVAVVDAFEVYGLLRSLRRVLTARFDISPLSFYERLIDWWRQKPGTLTGLLRHIYRDALDHTNFCEEVGWSGNLLEVGTLRLRPTKALTCVALTRSLELRAELEQFLRGACDLEWSAREAEMLRFQTDQWLGADYEARDYCFNYEHDWLACAEAGRREPPREPLSICYRPRQELLDGGYERDHSNWMTHLLRPYQPETRCVHDVTRRVVDRSHRGGAQAALVDDVGGQGSHGRRTG